MTRCITTQDPRDEVTNAAKTVLRLGAEEYSATFIAEAASHGFFQSNLDSTAELPDTDEGVRTTS